MAFSFDAPETTQGEGGGLSVPGTFHVVINDVVEGQTAKGKPIDGLTVTFEVLAGTVDGQAGKTRSETLFVPSLQDIQREEQSGTPSMPRKKLAALFIAANAMGPEQLGKPVNIDVATMVAQQLVIKFERQKEKDGQGKYTIETDYIQISYSDIFHVDDPAVAAVPKNSEALSLIEPAKRHPAAWFDWKKRKVAAPRPLAHAGSNSAVNAEDLW
jgi:hypothetical protein